MLLAPSMFCTFPLQIASTLSADRSFLSVETAPLRLTGIRPYMKKPLVVASADRVQKV
jgi:hypothetical protein